MHITFDVDIHRKLDVSAVDKTSGKERKITIANKNITKSISFLAMQEFLREV